MFSKYNTYWTGIYIKLSKQKYVGHTVVMGILVTHCICFTETVSISGIIRVISKLATGILNNSIKKI
jgi:hypothetical protein